MLKKAALGSKVITTNTDNFPMSGWIDPTFYNEGNRDVTIYNSTIEPGASFSAGVEGHLVDDTINVRFADDEDSPKVVVYFGVPKKC